MGRRLRELAEAEWEFFWVINEPLEAVLLPTRHQVSLGGEQLVFRMLRQPFVPGPLLPRKVLPLRADTLV